MPLFVWIGRDREGSAEQRAKVRPVHLESLGAHAAKIRFAGPLRDEHATPRGSVIVLEAANIAEARAIAASDPYAREGVFASWEVFETTQVFPATS
ncbi:MAG: hypothetical protein FJ091_14635 [Deltaproteobacteria bacterium]|nr:hypothetical protein [Deltaproteobacteria bacterium]